MYLLLWRPDKIASLGALSLKKCTDIFSVRNQTLPFHNCNGLRLWNIYSLLALNVIAQITPVLMFRFTDCLFAVMLEKIVFCST